MDQQKSQRLLAPFVSNDVCNCRNSSKDAQPPEKIYLYVCARNYAQDDELLHHGASLPSKLMLFLYLHKFEQKAIIFYIAYGLWWRSLSKFRLAACANFFN
jgi:hypothetical protein